MHQQRTLVGARVRQKISWMIMFLYRSRNLVKCAIMEGGKYGGEGRPGSLTGLDSLHPDL